MTKQLQYTKTKTSFKLFQLQSEQMDHQFPPSSPVTHDTEQRDPFSKLKGSTIGFPQRGRFDYPTPNPSSTAGRSSSPARQADDSENNITFSRPAKTTAPINKSFNIVNPDSLVLRVPLLTSKPEFFIGRSLKSCDFSFKPIDKAVSRTHIKVYHSDDSLAITCLGYNGVGMILPRVCEVHKVEGKESYYRLQEASKPLKLQNLSKTIHLDYQHTEFHVSRGETVEMPRFTNILFQIHSKVVLLNPDDYEEALTDEEDFRLMKATENDHNIDDEVPSKKQDNAGDKSTKKEDATPLNSSKFEPCTPKKVSYRVTSEEPTPIKTSKLKTSLPKIASEDKENAEIRNIGESEKDDLHDIAQPFKRATTPMANRTNNVSKSPLVKRRATSEEPVGSKKSKKEPARDAEGKLIIDDSCIKGLKNVREISNILINHLAFSRLSSTPASFLNTILAVVSELTLEQLRTVLHQIDCIGVIYREGKDAAGKPLEEEYYYIPEKDEDSERTKLVSSIKGHGGLRACRRKHKQYYWKKPAPIKK